MLEDRYGLELSTSSVEARDAYVDAADKMLAANGHVEECLAMAIRADPSFALPHAALARQDQLCGRGKEARASAETASELVADATVREQQHVEIVSRMVTGQVSSALELTHQHLDGFPRDALALAPACGVFGSIGFSGRVDREAEQLALLEPLATHYGDDWWFLTVYSFALIETGDWTRGRELAERSLEQFRGNPHGAHTLAHALYEAGADEEATSFLAGWLPELEPESLLHCHLWWHYAILLMTKGDLEVAQQVFRENFLPGISSSPSINVVTDSASFLWRSELAGAPRDVELWELVSKYSEEQFRRPIVFVDAHVGLAYAALGKLEELEECVNELQELGDAGRLPAGTTAVSLTRAYEAFGSEDWAGVIDILEPMINEVVRIGGSRAQRDLVTNTLLAAYVNDGHHDDATNFLQRVHDRQPSRPVLGLS
jgi:tetratricopeptide (TPR) repeat protein